MKKTALLLLVVGAICSCSKKNDTPVVPKPTPTPTPPPTQQFDYIAKIEGFRPTNGGKGKEMVQEINFNYDNQMRLVSVVEKYPNSTIQKVVESKFSYSGQTIKFVHNEHERDKSLTQGTEYYLTLDTKGKATKLVEKNYPKNTSPKTYTAEGYTYDNKGHLTEYKRSEGFTASLTWQNGNMTKWVHKSTEETETEPWRYTSYPNRTYPDLGLFLRGRIEESYWVDHLGLRSANITSGYTIMEGEEGQSIDELKYKLDAKGRPIEVEEASNGNLTWIHVITYVKK